MAEYKSNLSPQEWQIIKPYFPRAKKRGRPREHKMKDIFNAIDGFLLGINRFLVF